MDMNEIQNNQLFKNMSNSHFDPENSIRYEQFQTKHVTCDLTGESCIYGECCIGCPRAEAEVRGNIYNDNLQMFPTTTDSRLGVEFKTNWNRSFYEFESLESFKLSLITEWVNKLQDYTELPEGVKEQYHVWNNCSDVINGMYKVLKYMYLAEFPLIIVCEDRIFVEAPYITE